MEVRRVLFRAAKENGRPGKFLQSADASRGHLLRPLVLAGPVALHMRGGIVMRKIAGSERIDTHAVDRPFDAERLGEVGDRGFRRGRMRRPRAACPSECRADVKDGAGAPCGQPAPMQLLRTEKEPGEKERKNGGEG